MTKGRGIQQRRVWSDFEVQVLRMHYATTLTTDLAELLGRSTARVNAKANKLGLFKSKEYVAALARDCIERNPNHGSRAHRIQPGHVPANKGLRRPGFAPGDMARTQFKKGNVSANWMPVGSYRINGDAFVERKFADAPGPYKNRWIPVHREIWIGAHGPVPKGYVIAFKPGTKTTDPERISLEVLECITLAENCRRNSVHNLPQPLVDVCRLRARLTRAINKRSKEDHEEH